MDSTENDSDSFSKDDKNESDTIKIIINKKEEKYLLRIFPSKKNPTIIFKLEQGKIQTFYYIETFDLRDFRHKNKLFLTDDNIPELFAHLKEIRKNCTVELEKSIKQIDVYFKNNFDSNFVLNFTLIKHIISQKSLNPLLVAQIQENKAKIKSLKKQIAKLNKAIQAKTEIINDFKNNITNINNNINNINKNEEEEDNEDNNKDEEVEEISPKENSSVKEREPEEKRYISNNRKKKNKKQNKKIKSDNNANNNKNNQDNVGNDFCFENMEILGNKKFFEVLVIFNIITILIILCLLGSIYSIKSDLEYEKVIEQDILNKLAYFNAGNDDNDDDQYKLNRNKNGGDKRYINSLLVNEDQENFFKEEIRKIIRDNTKDIDLIPKFNSITNTKGFGKFYSNCKGIKDNLIIMKNDRGKKLGFFSKNLYEILHGTSSRDYIETPNNFIVYGFNSNNIMEYSFKNVYEIYVTLAQTISFYLSSHDANSQDKEDFSSQNKRSVEQLLGIISEIEIYQVKYKK